MGTQIDRARGCLFGQLIGDSLGSLVEFQSPEQIAQAYPDGVRDMHDGGTWRTLAGQPTDDSEMALALARSIIEKGGYDQPSARAAYVDWLDSAPFDVGSTVSAGLRGTPNFDSQANGALMRVSPLAIFAAGLNSEFAARHAREDAWITHPSEVTQDANVLFVLTISGTIREQLSAAETLDLAGTVAREHGLAEAVESSLAEGRKRPPADFRRSMGWVLIALQNAFYQLANAASFEDALVDTISYGGDTDTNAAICGALTGAVHGLDEIPQRWVTVIENCEPETGRSGVNRPRPRRYWPTGAASLAEQLLKAGTQRT